VAAADTDAQVRQSGSRWAMELMVACANGVHASVSPFGSLLDDWTTKVITICVVGVPVSLSPGVVDLQARL
jgi:hypothetical protein